MLKLSWDFISSSKQWTDVLRARTIRNGSMVQYSIKSSIWCGIKQHFSTVMQNVKWQVGDGRSINFWTDSWLSQSLVSLFNIPPHLHQYLKARVSDFLQDGAWIIPDILKIKYPALDFELKNISIPFFQAEDQLMWDKSESGGLSLKEAYVFHNPPGHVDHWSKLLWHKLIPPSKSILVWRIINNKLPTDDNLWLRGIVNVSMSSMCGEAAETIHHLFCSCRLAKKFWNWLASVINCGIDSDSIASILSICDKKFSSQVLDVIRACIINVFWAIWFCRNRNRFENKQIHFKTAIAMIIANVALTGNLSKGSMSSIQDFSILKSFDIVCKPGSTEAIMQVNWFPPSCNWVKCNIDGAAKGTHGTAGSGGLFRDHSAGFIGCFAANRDLSSSSC